MGSPHGGGSAGRVADPPAKATAIRFLVLSSGFWVLAALVLAGCGGPRQVSSSGAGAYEASITRTPNGFAVAWFDTRDGNADIYFRTLDASGEPSGPEHRLTSDPQLSYEADIQSVNDRFAVAWYDKASDGKLQAKLGLSSPDGKLLWTNTLSSAQRNGRNTIVRVAGMRLFAAWLEDVDAEKSEVWGGWWDLEGKPVVEPRLLAPAGRTTYNLNAAIDSSNTAWLVFDAKAGTKAEELFVVMDDKASASVFPLTEDDGKASKYPDLAIAGKRAALAWYDERDGNQEVYVSVTSIGDLGGRPLRVTNTPGHSIGAYVAWNGDRVGLAWSDDSEGQPEIYFRPFRADGTPADEATRVTNNPSSSLTPAIRPAGSGFALAWNESESSADSARAGSGKSEIAFAIAGN